MKCLLEVKCEKTRKSFYIQVRSNTDEITDTTIWTLEWVFTEDEQRNNESPIPQNINNRIQISQSYRGCPHCGNMGLGRCVCGKIFCFNNQHSTVTCPWCNTTSSVGVESSKSLSCSDGGYQGSR